MEILPPNSRGRVLFADDDQAARDGLTAMLRKVGYDCTSVPNAGEALDKLRAESFEALISDIHMPGNTTLEIVAAATQIVPGLPVLLLTGRPTVETAARSVRLPVTAYLTKPPDLEELTRTLDQAIADFRDFTLIHAGRERLRNWEKELEEIERLMSRPATDDRGAALENFVRVSLRQAILALTELERATQALDRRTGARSQQLDHIAALQHTVDVLERTRQNFKSKELADLRKQLEVLLGREKTR
jgi:CheY-like chemotaxis protein